MKMQRIAIGAPTDHKPEWLFEAATRDPQHDLPTYACLPRKYQPQLRLPQNARNGMSQLEARESLQPGVLDTILWTGAQRAHKTVVQATLSITATPARIRSDYM